MPAQPLAPHFIDGLYGKLIEGGIGYFFPMDEVWMVPAKNAEGERFYFGVGKWDLLGGIGPLLSHFRDLLDFIETLRVRSVAEKIAF